MPCRQKGSQAKPAALIDEAAERTTTEQLPSAARAPDAQPDGSTCPPRGPSRADLELMTKMARAGFAEQASCSSNAAEPKEDAHSSSTEAAEGQSEEQRFVEAPVRDSAGSHDAYLTLIGERPPERTRNRREALEDSQPRHEDYRDAETFLEACDRWISTVCRIISLTAGLKRPLLR